MKAVPNQFKRTTALLVIDASLGASAVFLAHALAFSISANTVGLYVAAALVGPILLASFRVYEMRARYFGLHDSLSIAGASFVLVVLLAAVSIPLSASLTPSISVLTFFFSIFGWVGARVLLRAYAWRKVPKIRNADDRLKRRTLIIGAGDAGEAICRDLLRASVRRNEVVGFLDDDVAKLRSRIHGISVLGKTAEIEKIAEAFGVDQIIIAIPSADSATMRRIVERAKNTKATVSTLPAISELEGRGKNRLYSQVRQIGIEDLLQRSPVKTDLTDVQKYIEGKTVLVTGAGGSIGSELVRQIAKLSVGRLVLVGHGENSIFEIEQEIIRKGHAKPVCYVADVRDFEAMHDIFERENPSVVLHAAAHKHVPLMQGNVIEAIRNNVLGTWNTAYLATRFSASRFILVSTDKAVRPTSIMGATKRLCEILVGSFAPNPLTKFAIVRFGNVLGSRGSLVPQLNAQIRDVGEVRITDPEMTRYFMTIPEASQLILQAGAICQNGELFLLDMGQPIKILDLAKDLIRLHGFEPEIDIPIRITGKRPGEKLHEELSYHNEDLMPTSNPKILRAANISLNNSDAKAILDQLMHMCDNRQAEEAKSFLMDLAWGKIPNSANEEAKINQAVVAKTIS